MVVGSPTKLNLIPSGVMPVVYINHGDAGYDKEFLIYNGDSPYNVPSGVSATIRGTKADKHGVTEAATVTTGSNLVSVTITEQMTAAAGDAVYELVFVDTSGLRVASINMIWRVKKDALGDSVISDSDLDYASQVLDQLQSVAAVNAQVQQNKSNITTLQSGLSTETSNRTSQDNLLQAQIDQLIAPTGEAPSAAEVQNARIGADGTTYDTLGNAIRGQVSDLKNDLILVDDATRSIAFPITLYYNSGTIDSSGGFVTNNTRIRTLPIPISAGDFIETDGTYSILARIYNSVTQSAVSYYGVSGGYQTKPIDLTPYVGKLAVIVAKKVGHENENISADVSTIGNHITFSKTSQIKTDYNAIKSEYDMDVITPEDFDFASINSSGVITWLNYSNGYGNAITKEIRTDSITIKPVLNSVMFRVVYYSTSGTWVSSSPWYSKETTSLSSAVDKIEVGNTSYRLMIACTSQGQNKSIAELFSGLEIIKQCFRSPLIPFDGYKIDAKLTKVGSVYKSAIDPHDHFINVANGVTVFLDPNGLDTNDGLTVLTPKKTFSSALAVSNVNTIVLAEGTYQAGTHFAAGLEITQAINIIGIGNVIIDNGTGYPLLFYRSIYCENIHFRGGNDTVNVKLGAYDRIATFYHCKFTDSAANNGLTILGGIAYVIECEACRNAYDGFNYHKYNSIVNHAIEIDCKSYGNGTANLTASDGQSSNGSTTHDGSYIVRVNGEYYACHGGIVADKDAYSANYGCSAGISTITDPDYSDRMSNYWSSGANMYLYGCISYGSKYDTAIIRSGHITSDTTYGSNFVE